MLLTSWFRKLTYASVILLATGFGLGQRDSSVLPLAAAPSRLAAATPAADPKYVVLSWNDLGMHCYNRDFRYLAVLPPYNTLWAQVVRRGNPPEVVTTGITVTYAFADNTTSVTKSNFWTYANALFGVDLAPDVGLTGRGLRGAMDLHVDHFAAEGIPLTEFTDSAPTVPAPYQLATVTVRAADTGLELARTTVVAPVSTEMHCDNCHQDGGVEDIATGSVELNILTLHDEELGGDNGDDGDAPEWAAVLPDTSLVANTPVLCADCHASNALGKPGVPEVKSLSNAMHEQHAGKVPNSTEGCYNCHPGPSTRCLRDVMSQEHGMGCVDCHGTMEQVAQNATPWLKEPRCDTCHDDASYAQNQPLYRMSSGHGGLYCAGCHDSPHAIAPSAQPNDGLKFIELQGHRGPLDSCEVCHTITPNAAGPHGMAVPNVRPSKMYLPLLAE
jgi:hypothetical protein